MKGFKLIFSDLFKRFNLIFIYIPLISIYLWALDFLIKEFIIISFPYFYSL